MSKRVRVDLGERGYDIVVGADAMDELAMLLAGRRRAAIVSQRGIAAAYADRVRAVLDRAGVEHELFTMGDGEDAKTLASIDALNRAFTQWGLVRSDVVLALGGGVVGDTAGFAAATYYRGVDVVQIPTTLLAMVDAAIGGKTGVNLPEGKNLVGAFHQPLAVLADPETLGSLPAREYRCGLGEVAKYALIDRSLRPLDADGLNARDPGALTEIVTRCAAIKARYVAADEFERSGARAILNYGHTLAHALETASGHALMHGEAVAVGLVFAGELAGALERIDPHRVADHRELMAPLGLPDSAPPGLRADDLLAIMQRDKKSAGGLTFVLDGPNGIERVDDPDPGAVRKAFAAIGVVT
ncbi:MAG: 3-dehydroquinate synthase [Actinomycetota bacterium]